MPVMKRRSFGVPEMLLFLSVAILVIVVAVPVLLILYTSFFVDGHFNAGQVMSILSEPDIYEALLNSLFIASGTCIMSTFIGTLFAWLVVRTDLPYKGFMKTLFLVPFMLPSFIGAAAVLTNQQDIDNILAVFDDLSLGITAPFHILVFPKDRTFIVLS